MLVWVDDICICSDSESDLFSFKQVLSDRFRMKDLGKLKWFLGIEFEYHNEGINMFQSNFISRVLDKFSMSESTPRSLPCDVHVNKFDFSESPLLDNSRIYREIVGSLIYIMTCSRPDLSYVITKLSQHMASPTEAHLNLARNVLRYLKGSINVKLCFRKSSEPLNLFGYCDSDWAGSEDRKSLSGYCYRLCKNGPLISWKTKKQNVVSLSSCEAEYTALTFVMQEGKFLSQLLADFYGREKTIFHLFVDNQGAINLGNNPVYHQRSKHIDVKYHFVRHEIREKNVKLVYVPTNDNVADMFTKPVSRPKMIHFDIFAN